MGLFDSAKEARDMDFGDDVSQGISKEGMQQYMENLQADLLTKVNEKLEETDGISQAIARGWQGQSRDKFLDQFEKGIRAVQSDLQSEYSDLMMRLSELTSNYYSQDAKMVD